MFRAFSTLKTIGFALIIITVSFTVNAQKNLPLWAISTEEHPTPSYIFATIHTTDTSVFQLPSVVNEKLIQSSEVVLLQPPGSTSGKNLKDLLVLPKGTTLKNLLPLSQYQETDSLIGLLMPGQNEKLRKHHPIHYL